MNAHSNNKKHAAVHILRQLGAILAILALAAYPAGSGQTHVQAETSYFYDDFAGPDLEEGWYWQGNPAEYEFKVDGESTFITFPSSHGESVIDLRYTLLRPVAPGDFSIETRVLFEPDSNYETASLVIYQDDGNFLQLGRIFCDVEKDCQGNGIYFDKVINESFVDGNFATPVGSPNDAYLRLERRGEKVRGFFSYESVTWTEIGMHQIPADFQVNGVGLAVTQSMSQEQPISADFDFFELGEGWGFLPEGFHDYAEGVIPNWNCNAGGWAADPDNREADLAISIAIDGVEEVDQEWWAYAGSYREDLDAAGVCVDGNCSFERSLLDFPRMSLYEPHQITVYAQSVPEGDWVRLSSSPKEITCFNYDIYSYDPINGETRQITDMRDTGEYNPSWSPNGKKVAHLVVYDDNSYEILITDVDTGISTPLEGAGEGSNNAAWSPNGRWIAFDRAYTETLPNMYIVPAVGGTPDWVRADAIGPDWAPNSQRLVFQDTTDGSIRTVPVGKAKGGETRLVDNGAAPAWSPDGNWIAYESGGQIWKIAVNVRGTPLGEPIQLTSLPVNAYDPTWSMDSQTITFHTGETADDDLWTVPAAGGDPAWLTGAPNFGDYSPDSAKNSPLVAYASVSPDGQAPRHWISAYSADLEPGFWASGKHTYQYKWDYSWPESGGPVGEVQEFLVTEGASLFDGYALLRQGLQRGIRTLDGLSCESIGAIDPGQPTRLLGGWVTDYPMTYSEALAHFASLKATAWIDGGTGIELVPHEILSGSSIDWLQYICGFSEAPLSKIPPKMDLRVNYGHDWVESFYEPGHDVLVTVTDGDGNVKATTDVSTEEFDWTPGYFQTYPEGWVPPGLPDILPGDWVFAEVDNGATAQVQIGVIDGTVDVATDSVQGTIDAPWFSQDTEIEVECHPWGAQMADEILKYDAAIPDGVDLYSCAWDPGTEWNIDYDQDVGVAYIGPDGHWVANFFVATGPELVDQASALAVNQLLSTASAPIRLMQKPLDLLYKQIG